MPAKPSLFIRFFTCAVFFFLLAFVSKQTSTAYEPSSLTPQFIEEHLFSKSPDGVAHVGPATLENYRGIKIMHLYGRREQMAYQHSVFAKNLLNLKDSAPEFFATAIGSALASFNGLTGFFERGYINVFIRQPLIQNFSNDDNTLFEYVHAGSGYELEQIRDAAIFPDTAEYLLAKQYANTKSLGCSTVIVEPARSSMGLMHARNLDFYAEGVWEKEAAVIYFHPDEPGAQWYAGVGSLGIMIPTPTAFNESGLVIDLHQLTTKDVSTHGMPILMAVEKVIRNARTLQSAIEAFRAIKYISPWQINISSAHEGLSATIDVAPSSFNVYYANHNLQISTNIVHDQDLHKTQEFFPHHNWQEDVLSRQRQLEQKTKTLTSISLQNMIDLISDHDSDLNGAPTPRALHGPVARIDNVTSVVFAPSAKAIWLAVPNTDFACSADGRYVALPYDGKLRAFSALPDMNSSHPLTDELARARLFYRQAIHASEIGATHEDIIANIAEAKKSDPDQALYSLMIGLEYFQMIAEGPSSTQSAQFALQYLQQAQSLPSLSPYITSLINLFIGRTYTLLGQKAKAITSYQLVDKTIWPPLTEAVTQDLKEGYTADRIVNVQVDYEEADVFTF